MPRSVIKNRQRHARGLGFQRTNAYFSFKLCLKTIHQLATAASSSSEDDEIYDSRPAARLRMDSLLQEHCSLAGDDGFFIAGNYKNLNSRFVLRKCALLFR